MVPKVAREEIESIFSQPGGITTIVTTPTLMQGVNLEAEKIFLVSANRGVDELSDFEFNNLIGRVGRVDTKLYGSIYCIKAEGEEWADKKLEDAENKEVESATSKVVNDAEKLIEELGTDLDLAGEPFVRHTAVLLRAKYLREDDNAAQYLEQKGMESQNITRVQEVLEETLEEVSLPEAILRKNPTVDPVSQNALFNLVQENPENWILGGNRFEYSYSSFFDMTRALNSIFKLAKDEERDVEPLHQEVKYGALEPIIITANKWLNGQSYRRMIEKRQEIDSIDDNSINDSIRAVLNLVDNDIGFVFVKYYGILTTILDCIDYDVPDWMMQFDKMLEMGSMDFRELRLMSHGVDRSVAVDLYIPDGVDDAAEYFRSNPGQIPTFHRRHFEKQDIL
jgi:hypothetical protein